MPERVVITGGAGCIGSDLAEALVRAGEEVTVIDNLSSGKREHIEPLMGRPNFRFLEVDLLDFEGLREGMAGAEMVYHLAANPDVKFVPGEPTDKDLKQNTIATYHVLEAMRQQQVKKIAFASTSAVYGLSERQPIPETQPLRPISLYGAHKAACEAMISAFRSLFSMDCWIFRFANIVGRKTRQKGKTVIGDFVERLRQDPTRLRILGNGLQAKSYLLSEECVEAMRFAVGRAPGGLSVYNLGCRDSVTVNRIADMVVEAMGLGKVRYEYTGGEGGWPGDVPRFLLDATEIEKLGWRARHSSEEALSQAIESVCRQ